MPKRDACCCALEVVPAPQWDEQTAADLARIVGIEESSLDNRAFQDATLNVLLTFYKNILHEKAIQDIRANALKLEAETTSYVPVRLSVPTSLRITCPTTIKTFRHWTTLKGLL
jgi:hypothetical protein